MDKKETLRIWMGSGPWSDWIKVPLFEQLGRPYAASFHPLARDVSWAPAADAGVAIVIDLPGREAVDLGVVLARERGYRPIPLHDVCSDAAEILDQGPILGALGEGAEQLARIALPTSAPPAFILDARRMRPERPPAAGRFDNRWRVYPGDLPSAEYLRSHGVTRVLVVQGRADPLADLAEPLYAWQAAGIAVEWRGPGRDDAVAPIELVKTSWLGRFLLWVDLPRRSAGRPFGTRWPQSAGG